MSFSPTPWPHTFGFTPIDTFGVLAKRNAGRQIAIAKGVRFGPKPKLTDHQQVEALKRLAAGASCRAIAKTMGVHHATIARLTGNHRAGSEPPPESSEA